MRIPPGHPDYSRWVVNDGEPAAPQRVVAPPTPSLADVELDDGAREALEMYVVATARAAVRIRPHVPQAGPVARVGARRAHRRRNT